MKIISLLFFIGPVSSGAASKESINISGQPSKEPTMNNVIKAYRILLKLVSFYSHLFSPSKHYCFDTLFLKFYL